ncbi:MAG: amidohydrolase [Saprospiraceae bacterium]|nr:amidohydrolase [Saprospiraceae bacterium]
MTDLIFRNGIFLSPNLVFPDPSVWEAILVKNGYIAAMGNLEDIEKKAAIDAQVIDLNGQTLMPAFNDAHIHIWKVGDLLTFMLDLRGVGSLAEMQEKIADFAAKNPNNTWILARGFNEANFPDGKIPSRFDLDTVVSDRPCYVIRTCAHVAVLNTRALTLCGITEETIVPEGGEIRRFKEKQIVPNLTGVLSETALGLAQKFLPKYTPEALKAMVLAAQTALLKQGITAATDPAVMPDLLAVYKDMDARKELKIRINAIPIVVPDGATEALPLPALYESDFLKINTVKFFADGGLSGKTAALKKPYKKTNEHGVLRLNFDFFMPLAAKAQAAGFKIATHAIGDRAIDEVLKVYKFIAKDNTRQLKHRIEHLGLPSKNNLKLMHKLGIHCVTQPIFLYELGQNFRHYLSAFYLKKVYPYKSVLEANVNLAFSSDAPVVKDFNPLMGIQNAIKRMDKQGFVLGASEKISVSDALLAYTLNAAKVNDDDKIMGSLEVGKRADFVILDKNPLNTEGDKISDIRVVGVFVMGFLQG